MKLWVFIVIATASCCELDSECSGFDICTTGVCEQRPLFPLTTLEIIGVVLIFATSGIANAAGVSGGTLFVVYFLTIFGFNASDSVAYSQFNSFTGSLIALIIKLFMRHPTQDKPVIDYDLVLLVTSPLLIGSALGVIVNILLPYWGILLILVGLSVYVVINTSIAFLNKYHQESLDLNQNLIVERSVRPNADSELGQIYRAEADCIPRSKALIICSLYLLATFFSFVRGSKSYESIVGLDNCSGTYWVLSLIMLVGFLGLYKLCEMHVRERYEEKIRHKYEFDRSDIRWTTQQCMFMGLCGLGGGFIGAVISVGGAIVINQVLIKRKIRPEVMSATSTLLVVFNSSISALQYTIVGRISLVYGLLTSIFSIGGSAVGVFAIRKLVVKYKRSSFILLIFPAISSACIISTTTYGIYHSIYIETDFGFHSYCA